MHALRLGRRNLFHACATSSFGKTLETFLTHPGVTGHGARGEHEDNLRDGVLPFFCFCVGEFVVALYKLQQISNNVSTQLDHTPSRKFRKWYFRGGRSNRSGCNDLMGCTLQLNLKKLTFLLELRAPESWLAVEKHGPKRRQTEGNSLKNP